MRQAPRQPQRRIYMDANATTPLLAEVFEAMRPFLLESFGNPSSIHQQGQRARAAVDKARDAVARLLNVRASEVVFTSGGTESDNLALFGVLRPGDHLVTSAIEHHAVLHAAHALEKRGVEVTFLPSDSAGIVSPDSLAAALRPNTRLVSIMLANNETGVIQPIQQLAALAKAHGALFHTDAVQGAGKIPLNLSPATPAGPLSDVDLLSLSGHKMYAPQGVGVLFVRQGVQLNPLFHGGTHERQRRAGTENVAGIVALGKAAELAMAWMAAEPVAADTSAQGAGDSAVQEAAHGVSSGTACPADLAALRDRLEQALLAEVPACGTNGAGTPRTANTTNLFFDHIDAESLVITLDLNGLSVSGGSACQSGAAEPSHVLTAMGLSASRARSSVRISLSRTTSVEEIEDAIRLIASTVAQLRSISRTWAASHAALAPA